MPNGTSGTSSGDSGGQATDAVSAVTDQAEQVAGQVQQQAGQLTDQAREMATSQLTSQKERAAGTLGTVAEALRQTSQQVREQDQGAVAQYIEKAADQAEQFSRSIREQDLNQLLDATERWARRQPALFLGGTFALGFLATRFFKSSRQQQGDGAASATSTGTSTGQTGSYASELFAPGYEGSVAGTSGYGTTPVSDFTSSGSEAMTGSDIDDLPPLPDDDLTVPEER